MCYLLSPTDHSGSEDEPDKQNTHKSKRKRDLEENTEGTYNIFINVKCTAVITYNR